MPTPHSSTLQQILISGLRAILGLSFSFALASGSSAQSARTFDTVEVRGAEFIPVEDIKMTCGAEPDVPYLDLELEAIENCLMSTGVFESVELVVEDTTLVINVQEVNDRPGRIEASLAYDSRDGLIGGLFFERYNFLPDTYGMTSLEYNPDVKRLEARLYRTDVIGDAVDLGVRLGWEELSFDDDTYAQSTYQAEAYLAWTYSERTRFEAGLGYRGYRLFDVASTASPILKAEETSGIDAPFLRFAMRHSSLDSEEEGWDSMEYSVGMDHYFWNLGTSDQLSEFRLNTRSYLPLASNWRFVIALDAGTVSSGDGSSTRVMDRFAPGAGAFRGFAPRGIGPRDGGTALGGQNYVVSTFELQRKLKDLIDAPLVGGVFWQTGSAWGLEDTLGGAIDDSFHRRSSVGLSLSFEVQNAPVSIYVATPTDKVAGDKEQVFGLSLSTQF